MSTYSIISHLPWLQSKQTNFRLENKHFENDPLDALVDDFGSRFISHHWSDFLLYTRRG